VETVSIRLRVHGHRADPELSERPEDANRDLAPIGNENFRERWHWDAYSPRR
jgi:hypothetical protein